MSVGQPATLLLLLALGACESDSGTVKPTQDNGSWLHYEGTFVYFVEQPEGTTDCGRAYHHGYTSGYFGVNNSDGALALTWEGMGCAVNVEGSSTGLFTASDAPCNLAADSSIQLFGIESIHFDDFAFDPEESTLTARGRIRRTIDGQKTSYCFELPDVR